MSSTPAPGSRRPLGRRAVLRLGGVGAVLGASSWLTACSGADSAGSEPQSLPGEKDMSTQNDPERNLSVLLVHGAFAESASWNPVISRLRSRSVDVVAVANPLRSVSSDATY